MKTKVLPAALVASTLLLASCATAPKPLQGSFAPVTPREAVTAGSAAGAAVRWGGSIIETRPQQDRTCFELVSRSLGSSGRPLGNAPDATGGRFIACRAGFYDPAVFTPGRDVTFIGRVDGVETTRIGEYDYRLPRMTADVVYLWPEEIEVRVRHSGFHDPFYSPYWGPRWGRWGWW